MEIINAQSKTNLPNETTHNLKLWLDNKFKEGATSVDVQMVLSKSNEFYLRKYFWVKRELFGKINFTLKSYGK